jgi:2-keto-4-pentenoate hydratase/2-oxohepta-3-ene-1,7-dioic acid hydratase in catechol pathway
MRICRYDDQGQARAALFYDERLVPLKAAAEIYAQETGQRLELPAGDDLLCFLPPDGPAHAACRTLEAYVGPRLDRLPAPAVLSVEQTSLLVPVPRPNKLFLLAGNYAEHIREGGGMAVERAETFPYVFMKPPSTTLLAPGRAVRLPEISPAAIDWELELAVIIGRRTKRVAEAEALGVVAGYTIINDISDRRFRPNPQRRTRDRDAFFDWMHGKWHDGFCPCGPCILSADCLGDPQTLRMELRLNGEVRQQASTAQQIFPVAAVIAFISSFVTLEPGDIISTGTPSGVGAATGTFLKPGDRLEASIAQIGTLVSTVEAE